MQANFEFGDHAEISSATAQRPKQLSVLARVGSNQRSIGRDHRESFDVVTRKPEQARQPARAAAQDQTAGPGMRNDAGGKDQPFSLRGTIHGSQQRAAGKSRT